MAWTLQMMISGTRTHGSARDPLLSDLSTDDIEELAAWFASVPAR
jgi:cytochrome c553